MFAQLRMSPNKTVMKQISPRIGTATVSTPPANTPSQALIVDWNHHSKALNGGTEKSETNGELTMAEEQELRECESILHHGLATFFEVGNALLQIREMRLYRTTHTTFEQYCRDRWHIGRSYACRVIGATERVNLLPDKVAFPRPANEFQVRPFLKLSAEQFPGAWERAVRLAKTGTVTPRIARIVIREVEPTAATLTGSDGRSRPKLKRKFHLGQVIALLYRARCCIEKNQDENAIEALERIEKLLCGPN